MSLFTSHCSLLTRSKRCPMSSAFRAWATLWLWATMRGSFEGRLRCWPMALLSSQHVFSPVEGEGALLAFRQEVEEEMEMAETETENEGITVDLLSSNQHVGLITLHLKSASECRFWPYLHIFRQQISYVSFSWQRDEANMFSVFQTMALLRARHAENAELFQKVVHPIHHGFYFPVKMIWEMQLILFMIYPNHPYCSLRPSAQWGGRPPHYLQWMASVWRCLTRIPKDKAGAQDALTWPLADSQIHQGFLQIWSFCETKNPKYSLSFIHSSAFQLAYDFGVKYHMLKSLKHVAKDSSICATHSTPSKPWDTFKSKIHL